MATVFINDKPVDIGDEKLNVVQAALKGGVFIPHYCWHPALSVVASCRMCLVEVGEKKPDGTIVMQPKLVPGCQTPVKENTVIVADMAYPLEIQPSDGIRPAQGGSTSSNSADGPRLAVGFHDRPITPRWW